MGWMKRDPVAPGPSSDLEGALNQLRAKIPGCPPPDMLQAAQTEVLPEDQAKEIKQHLERCSLCKSLLADLETLDTVDLDRTGRQRIWKQIQTGLPTEKVTKTAGWWWLRPVPIAGVVAAIAILVAGTLVVRNRQKPEVLTAENRPSASVPPAPSVLRLEKPPVILPASATVLWRGQQDSAGTQARDLKRALVPYQADNYVEASQRLSALHKKYPQMAAAAYYLGICQLFLNQNEEAAKTLKGALDLGDSVYTAEATWYLALANYRTGRADAANTILNRLCRAGGPESNRACTGVQELNQRR